jgi:hypothetical protein
VALLALVALDPAAWGPARFWILALVVTRSAFAAWAGGLRVVFGTGRIVELRGWIGRSPLLALAFGLIVIAGLGFPGLAAFEARSTLVELAADGPLTAVVLLGTLAPLAYYGRLLSIGLGRPDGPADPEVDWRPRPARADLTDLRGWWRTTWAVNRAFSSGLMAVLLALLAVATSAGAFDGPVAAALPGPGDAIPSSSLGPGVSGGLGRTGLTGGPESPPYSFGASTHRSTSRS